MSGGKIEFPEAIFSLKELKELDIYTSVKDWPDRFSELSKLEKLTLGYIKTELPESIGNLKNLKYLKVQFHNCKTIPVSYFNLSNLETLCIFGKSLETLPSDILILPNLKKVELGWGIKIKNMPSIPEHIEFE